MYVCTFKYKILKMYVPSSIKGSIINGGRSHFFSSNFSKKFFSKNLICMFLDPLNPNLASIFRFEASKQIYANFYREKVNFLKQC